MQATLFEASVTGAVCDHDHAFVVSETPAEIAYFARFLPRAAADSYFEMFLRSIDWSQQEISLYGKRHPIPRLTAWYGDPGAAYTYSKIRNEPHPWTPALLELLAEVQEAANAPFNSVLLNRYRSGSDSLSWHSDDEPELGDEPVIASVSLGAGRAFALRSKDGARKATLRLEHGSLLIMRGTSQQIFQHSVPKEKTVSGERINLTFRVVHGGRAS